MSLFRRRRRRVEPPLPLEPVDPWPAMRAIVAEAVIWQDAAEALLADVRARLPLSELAPRGGPLVTRFMALESVLPVSDDPEVVRRTTELRQLLSHHAHMISASLDMLATDWRSERIVEQLDKLDGLGEPARRLEAFWDELKVG
jgi:hypothetical protein